MKKMIVALLALVLVFSFVSCDAMLDVMNKMGNNVAGTEKKVIEDSLNAAKPSTSGKTEVTSEDGNTTTKTFSQGTAEDSKAMFAIEKKKTGEFGETSVSLKIGEDISISLSNEAAKIIEDVNSVLTPTDLTDVLNGLKGGSKDEIANALKEPADDESKAAAEGTQKVISALVEPLNLSKVSKEDLDKMEGSEKEIAEAMNKALDTLDTILGKGEEEKVMTQADVVVLTAITNLVFNNVEDVIGSMGVINSGSSTEEEKDEASQKLTEAIANEAVTMIDVVSVVPSDMASGILDVLNLLTSSSK